MTEVTREQLTAAVDGMEVVVDMLAENVTPGTWVGAKIRYPGSFASAIFERLADQVPSEPERADRAAGPAPAAPAYPELTAVAAIFAALDGIDDGESAGQPHGPFWRVLTFVASRYGYVLATED